MNITRGLDGGSRECREETKTKESVWNLVVVEWDQAVKIKCDSIS